MTGRDLIRKVVDSAIESNGMIAQLVGDVITLKGDINILKSDMKDVKEELHRQGVLGEERDHKLDLVLEVVLATQRELRKVEPMEKRLKTTMSASVRLKRLPSVPEIRTPSALF